MDQAEKLRKIMNSKKIDIEVDIEEEVASETRAKVISISSGKGGVGKTNFAINFAIALKKLGHEVVIIDADIGLGNVEILSGTNLKHTISDIIFSDKSITEIIGDGPAGIKIISGGSGLQELTLLNDENLPKLISEIDRLQSIVDYIIIDTGAGISPLVIDFIMASNEVIVVSTGDPTSIMDSYILIKSLIATGFDGFINIVANLVKNRKEGEEVYNKLNNASNNFLRVQTNYLGYIERNDSVNHAVKIQVPFMVSNPNSTPSKRVMDITMNHLDGKEELEANNNKSFARKLLNIFKKR